uniref:G-protein coupled receptors family 1 profile domain-containing protein n=1 Tax=Glossina austeni TaxID=7395 RepID=A0A1A9UJ15_GLOAU
MGSCTRRHFLLSTCFLQMFYLVLCSAYKHEYLTTSSCIFMYNYFRENTNLNELYLYTLASISMASRMFNLWRQLSHVWFIVGLINILDFLIAVNGIEVYFMTLNYTMEAKEIRIMWWSKTED